MRITGPNVDGTTYFMDERLKQFRNTDDPCDILAWEISYDEQYKFECVDLGGEL